MSDGLVIDVQDAGLIGALTEVANRLEHPRELMAAIGELMQSNIDRRFDTKTDPNGAPWAPLMASTLEHYAREDQGRRKGSLLERSGLMRDSLGFNAYDDAVEVGFGRPYAAFHESGTRRMERRGLLTADPDLGELGAQDRSDVQALIDDFLLELLG